MQTSGNLSGQCLRQGAGAVDADGLGRYMLIVLVTGRLLVPIELRREERSQEQVEGSRLDSGSAGTNPRCAQALAARARVLDLVRDGRLPGCLGCSTVYGESGISPGRPVGHLVNARV